MPRKGAWLPSAMTMSAPAWMHSRAKGGRHGDGLLSPSAGCHSWLWMWTMTQSACSAAVQERRVARLRILGHAEDAVVEARGIEAPLTLARLHGPPADAGGDGEQRLAGGGIDRVADAERVDPGPPRRVVASGPGSRPGGGRRRHRHQRDAGARAVEVRGATRLGEVASRARVGHPDAVELGARLQQPSVRVVEGVVRRQRDEIEARPPHLRRDERRRANPHAACLGGGIDLGSLEVVEQGLEVGERDVRTAEQAHQLEEAVRLAGRESPGDVGVAGERDCERHCEIPLRG
jgi:hypothetical protein